VTAAIVVRSLWVAERSTSVLARDGQVFFVHNVSAHHKG
jgi:hypothetical protein